MSAITRMPLAAPPPLERVAESVAEIKELYAAYQEAVAENERNERVIQRQQDKITMLEEALQEARAQSRVCERKLIRLATNQKNISRIAQDGDEIMRSMQEWNDEQDAGASVETGIREILERVTPSGDAETRTVPPANTP